MSEQKLLEQNQAELDAQILDLNNQLEETSQSSMSRAFNLGCSTGLIPAILSVIAVFILFKGSVIGAAFTALILAIGIVAFANLSAYLARARTIQRVYKEQINPKIEGLLATYRLTRQEFDDHANLTLPQDALLRMYLKPLPEHADETPIPPTEE